MKFGVAFGGGGVRGLAHIQVMESLDRLGIKPAMISGTSMGAIIGALYASGQKGSAVAEKLKSKFIKGGGKKKNLADTFKKDKTQSDSAELLKIFTSITPYMSRGGIISADRFLSYLLKEIQVETFEDLEIPFRVVATDFWSEKQVVISSGPLLPAVKASMAIPGIFPPSLIDGRVLVDGGVVNNVPWDVLENCEYTLAIDVAPTRKQPKKPVPVVIDAFFGMFDIMLQKITDKKLQTSPPSLYVRPELTGIRTLDFDKISLVFEQAAPSIMEMEKTLSEIF